MAKDELAKRWVLKGTSENPYSGVLEAFRNYHKGQQKLDGKSERFVFENPVCKELETVREQNRKYKNRSVFG